MDNFFVSLANFIIEHPEIMQKSEPEIYNTWFAKEKIPLKSVNDVKAVLNFIQSAKKIPQKLMLDSLRKE